MNKMEKVSKQNHHQIKKLSKLGKQGQKITQNENCTSKLKQFMTSTTYMFFMSILTIYSIFAIDIDKGFFNYDASVYFSSVHVLSMLIFTIEIIVASIVEKDYFLHFYFWIDIFSTMMMVLELIWIEDLMNSTDNIKVAVSFARVSKASRFSKIGARSTKIMKLIRLIKLMKLFRKKQQQVKAEPQKIGQLSQNNSMLKNQQGKVIQNQTNQDQKSMLPFRIKRPNVDPFEQLQIQMKWQLQSQQRKKLKQTTNLPKQEPSKGTKVGQILKYQIQKNIVIMVMSLITIVPLLSASTWFNKTEDMEPSTSGYFDIFTDQANPAFITDWCDSFIQVSTDSSRPVVYFNYTTYEFPTQNKLSNINSLSLLKNLRQSEQTIIVQTNYKAIYSKKEQTQITSWINMIRSILIIVLLLITSIMFVQDLETYALNPLEKMSATVCKIQKDPFSVLQDDQDNQEELIQQVKEQEELQLETNILEKFFIKITSLLALGVGETPVNSTSQILDTKQSIFDQQTCKNIEGIFVCLQLTNLNSIINELADQSSVYINHILEIFHQTAIQNGAYIFHQDDQYSLICWKIDSGLMTQHDTQVKIQEKRKAELAFTFYLQFCDKIAQDPKIKQYEKEHQFLANQSQCKFHLGFHCGVAYCGTIGSEFKLSLKAMGQDVSIVKSLCRAAGKYKLDNLMSDQFINLIPFLQCISRKIQDFKFVQTYKIAPIETYTICGNINMKNHGKGDNPFTEQNTEILQRNRIKKMLKSREQMLKNLNKSKADELTTFCKSYLKKHSNMDQYLDLWRQSSHCYQEGRWHHAKTGYLQAKECNFKNNDFLTEKRLQEIGNRQEPPSYWSQYVPFSLFL